MSSKNGHDAHKARGPHRPLPDTVAASREPWGSWRTFGFLQCVMLWKLIMAWQPYLVSAMDGGTIVQAAGTAVSTVVFIVVFACLNAVASVLSEKLPPPSAAPSVRNCLRHQQQRSPSFPR